MGTAPGLPPLVSIIIPAHNAGEHLDACILSAKAQSWPNKELLIIDDGSSDNSALIANAHAGSRVTVARQPNLGASSARNHGLKLAKGDYIQFLDADDLLSEDKVAAQVELLAQNPGKVAVSRTAHFPDGTNHQAAASSAYEDSFLADAGPVDFLVNLWGEGGGRGSMVQTNAWLVPAGVAKKAGPWNEQLSLDDDGEYFTRIVLASEGVLVSGGLNYYRKYSGKSGSLSARKEALGLKSLYHSARLKHSHFPAAYQASVLLEIYQRWLNELLFVCYPDHPQLMAQVEREMRQLGAGATYNPYQDAGGLVRVLNHIGGWKFTKRLQLMKQHILQKWSRSLPLH